MSSRASSTAAAATGAAARDELVRAGACERDATAIVLRMIFLLRASASGREPRPDGERPFDWVTFADVADRCGKAPELWPEVAAWIDSVSGTGEARAMALSNAVLGRVLAHLTGAPGVDAQDLGAAYELMKPGLERRRLGAHYTSGALARSVVERALGPLLGESPTAESILSLAILDPAMGSGAFLIAACEVLAEGLLAAWRRGSPSLLGGKPDDLLEARGRVASTCLFGVDKDPLAVESARLSLWLACGANAAPAGFCVGSMVLGDALVGLSPFELDGREEELLDLVVGLAPQDRDTVADFALDAWRSGKSPDTRRARLDGALDEIRSRLRHGELAELAGRARVVRSSHAPFHWPLMWPRIWSGDRPGFDAVVGNPPWVSFVGRAAQPLSTDERSFLAPSPAFFGYRNLQGVFVHRAAMLLRPGGRLGLIVPTSMSDLGGYAPSRAAHDALAECDPCLPDFGGGGFEGIFQPCMGLFSTRRQPLKPEEAGRAWPLSRTHLDDADVEILDALDRLPRLPSALFGERGYQTTKTDLAGLLRADGPRPPFEVALRVGGDVRPFARSPPRIFCDPTQLAGRLRERSEWQRVAVLIRQTARFPMAALSDGGAFRNSLLAGLPAAPYDAFFLVAYLNSSPVRHYHYMKHRDARQGMPQLKIAHLRALPAPTGRRSVDAIASFGRAFGGRNSGISPEEQAALDAVVCSGLGLDARAGAAIATWATSV